MTPSSQRTCTTCGGMTPGGFAYCQHCGARLAPVKSEVAVADTVASSNADLAAISGRRAVVSSEAFATTTPPTRDAIRDLPITPVSPPTPSGSHAVSGAVPTPPPGMQPSHSGGMPVTSGAPLGRLVSVRRDGSDGQAYPLSGDQVDIGRADGDLKFPDDRYMAARHARVERRPNGIVLRALDPLNGVYVRVVDVAPIHDGDMVLMGKEVFRFEEVDPVERDARHAMQHGTLVFASPHRKPWGRLTQLTISGIAQDVYHLHRPEIVLGREDGELRFPDDEFMSRRHAMVWNHDGKTQLRDLGSSNGTYVRLRGEKDLHTGDLVRMGDQLFRFEAT